MMSKGRNRRAGHDWERELARVFRDLGFTHVVTTRSESKSRDDQGIDLMNKDERANGIFPYNVQAKCSVSIPPYPKILSELPSEENVINVVLHKHVVKQNEKFISKGEYAILPLKDFLNLVRIKMNYDLLSL